jgi:DNA polymerase III subunit delta
MTLEEIIKDVKSGSFKPIYALYGDEPFFVDQAEQAITAHVLTEAERGFNQSILYGMDVKPVQLLDYVGRYPMGSARQLVVVREAQELDSIEPLASYFEKPAPHTVLVLSYKGKKPDFRTRAGKALKINALCFESKKLYDNQIPDWVMKEAKHHQLVIPPQSAAMIAEYIGTELHTISNQLEKLAISLPKGTSITEQHIKTYIGQSREYNVFDLYKALAERNTERSMKIVFRFLDNIKKNPLVPLVSGLYNFYSKVWVFHQVANKSESEQVSALDLKSAWALKDYRLAARHYTPLQCRKILKLLKIYDLKCKGVESNEADEELMKEMVLRVLAP